MEQRLDPQPPLPPELQEVAGLWESLRDDSLQRGSLFHLPAPTLQHLEEVLQRSRACLSAYNTLSPDVWKHHAWQLAVLQLLAVAASDVASAVISPTNLVYAESVGLCTVLLQCVERMKQLCLRHRTYRRYLGLHMLLARMQLLPTVARMVDAARSDFLLNKDARSVSRCSKITAWASLLLLSQLKSVTFMLCLKPDASGLLHPTLACTLQAILDSQLMEHVAFTLLPLAEAEHQVAANAAPTTPGAAASDGTMPVITSTSANIRTAFYAFNRAVECLKELPVVDVRPGSTLLVEVRQRLLGGPCLQTYVAARLTEALHLLDGSGRAGLPSCWPYLLPEGDGERHGSGRARRLTDADKESLTRAVWQLTQLLMEDMQPAPPNTRPPIFRDPRYCGRVLLRRSRAIQQAGTASAGNGTSHSGQRLPMSKARTFRLALRVLRWATGTGAGQSGARAIAVQQQELAAAAAAGTSAASLAQSLRCVQAPMLVAPCFLSTNAAIAAITALADWRDSTQRVERVHARACDTLPPIMALIHSAVSCSSTAAGSSGGGGGIPGADDEAVPHCLDTALSALCYSYELVSSAPRPQQGVAAAIRSGMLPALQACVAWLTPGRACSIAGRWDPKLVSSILNRVVQCSDRAMALSPEQQAAAFMVTTRSSFAAATAALDKEPMHPALPGLVNGLHQLLDLLLYQLLEYLAGEEEVPQAWHCGRTAVFALQQWAVASGHYVAGTLQGAMRVPGASCVSGQVWWQSAIAALCALAHAKRAAEDPAAAAPARAAALCAATSWRTLVLRDMRALDVLACDLRTLSRCGGQGNALSMMLDALELAAYALPEEVSQHIEAGRAARCGRVPPPSAAGRGPIWLAMDGPVRDLLGPTRCDRLPLLACLEGRSGGAAAIKATVEARPPKDLGLPPPCDAQLIEMCSYPGCGNGAYATAAASPAVPLSACAKCGCVRYCSRACQVVHWREWHKAECGKGWWVVP